MKTCTNCQRTLPLTNFYGHPKTADGHDGKCKECAKAYQKERRIWNGDSIREYDRARGNIEKRVKARKDYKQTPRGKERHLAGRAKWLERNREKRAAHVATGNAIRDGSLAKQPCETCGSPFVQAHHDDYSRPLEVRWLCVPCHNAHHKAERENLGKSNFTLTPAASL